MNPQFFEDERGFHARPLTAFEWLEHAFGTRHSPLPEPLVTVKQIHSVTVAAHTGEVGCIGEADAITTDIPGTTVGVKTADCLPVLIADPVHRAVAAVHAGWRGVAGNIVTEAIRQMQSRFDSKPADLHVAIGPGIGACCFEVGPEVAVQFGREGRVKIDLLEIVEGQLRQGGVAEGHIYSAGLCTVCDPHRFHSFRRDREASGRMMSSIGLKKRTARPV